MTDNLDPRRLSEAAKERAISILAEGLMLALRDEWPKGLKAWRRHCERLIAAPVADPAGADEGDTFIRGLFAIAERRSRK